MPAFLKLHRAEIAQCRVNASVVVEGHPVKYFIYDLPAGVEYDFRGQGHNPMLEMFLDTGHSPTPGFPAFSIFLAP